jgi:hypothetical protein
MSPSQAPTNENPWQELEHLLQQTRKALQASDYRTAEVLLQAAGKTVAGFAVSSPPPLPQEQKETLLQTYRQLMLISAAHQQAAQGQLRHIREGRKTLATYGRQV